MDDVHMMLKASVRTNTIVTFILSPPSHSFFEESIYSNQNNLTLRLSDSHTRVQQVPQTNGGGNQRGKHVTILPGTTTLLIPASRTTLLGYVIPSLTPEEHVCLVPEAAPTFTKSFSLLAMPVPTTEPLATEDITSVIETSH